MPPPPPVLTAHLFPDERAALLSLLESLAPEEWDALALPGWSVHDVTLHILGGDIGILSSRRDGWREPRGDTGDLSQWATLVAFINRRNAAWVNATRRISPPLVIEFLRLTGAGIAAHFAVLDPHATGAVVSWAGPEPAPVWLDTAREYTERWTHQQHIRDATGRPSFKERKYFAPVLDAFARALPHTLRDMPAPPGATVRLTITGDSGGEWFAVRGNTGWTLRINADIPPIAVVTLPDEIAWRLFTGGMRKEDAQPHVQCEGDVTIDKTTLSMIYNDSIVFKRRTQRGETWLHHNGLHGRTAPLQTRSSSVSRGACHPLPSSNMRGGSRGNDTASR